MEISFPHAFFCTSANFQLKAWKIAPGNSKGSISHQPVVPPLHLQLLVLLPLAWGWQVKEVTGLLAAKTAVYRSQSSEAQNLFGRFSSHRGMPLCPRHTNLKAIPGHHPLKPLSF